MPTYRSITLSVVSQHDIRTVPEFRPPATLTDPFVHAPTLLDEEHALVSVYIPIYPTSQFWLCYSISPPHPPGILYYFKLYINGTHIVSWGCGEEERYEGKTVFGMFHPGPTPFNESRVERRALYFGSDIDNPDNIMEVKVFRSKGRERKQHELADYERISGMTSMERNRSQLHSSTSGINLANAGLLPVQHPLNYYNYILVDGLHKPFATFHFHYRSWNQLEALGVISPSASIESSSMRSRYSVERPVHHQDSGDTIDSYYMSPRNHANNISANGSADAITYPPTNEGTTAVADDSAMATITAASSIYSQDSNHFQDTSSPLRAQIKRRRSWHRPPTPPPTGTSSKLAQLPLPMIPPSDGKLNTVASKESFTSLVRNRSHNLGSSIPQLEEPEAVAKPKRPSMFGKKRTTSMNVLKKVVSSATSRRKVTEQESEGESSGQRLSDATAKNGKGAYHRTSDDVVQKAGSGYYRLSDEATEPNKGRYLRTSDEVTEQSEGAYRRPSDEVVNKSKTGYHRFSDDVIEQNEGGYHYAENEGGESSETRALRADEVYEQMSEQMSAKKLRERHRGARIFEIPEDERMNGYGAFAGLNVERSPVHTFVGNSPGGSPVFMVDRTTTRDERNTITKTSTEGNNSSDAIIGNGLSKKEAKKAMKEKKKEEKKVKKQNEKEKKQREKEEYEEWVESLPWNQRL